MATEPVLTALEVSAVPRRPLSGSTVLSDYWALTKPEVNFLILVTTFAGFYLGSTAPSAGFPFLATVQYAAGHIAGCERYRHPESIHRAPLRCPNATDRPSAARRRPAQSRRCFLVWRRIIGGRRRLPCDAVNTLASLLTMVTLLSYSFVYTPLKRKTPLCTLAGAFPGAMPPLIGWAAASGKLNLQAWTLYAMLFLWQFPHFMAIAWMYREDYDRAGYLVLPHGSRARTSLVSLQTFLPLLVLLPLSLAPAFTGRLRMFFSIGVSLLSIVFLCYGIQFVLRRSNSSARRLLVASIIYLPLLFLLMVLPGG